MITIFLAPSFADKVGNVLWIKNFNEKIRNNWGDINRIFTNIPTTDELEKWYDDVVKKAKEFGEDVSSWINKTKETIDNIRTTLSWAEDKINDVKETYTDIKKTYEETIKTYDSVKKKLNDVEKVWDVIKNVVNTGTTQ